MTCNVILHSHISQKVPLRLEMPGLNLVRLWMKKYEVVPGSSHCWDATIHTSNIFKVFLLCSGRRSSNKIMSWTQHILGHPWASSGLVASLFLECLSTGGEGWKRHSGLYWPGLRDLVWHISFSQEVAANCNCYSSCKCIVCIQTVVKQLLVYFCIPLSCATQHTEPLVKSLSCGSCTHCHWISRCCALFFSFQTHWTQTI